MVTKPSLLVTGIASKPFILHFQFASSICICVWHFAPPYNPVSLWWGSCWDVFPATLLGYYTGESSIRHAPTISDYTPCLLSTPSNTDHFTLQWCKVYILLIVVLTKNSSQYGDTKSKCYINVWFCNIDVICFCFHCDFLRSQIYKSVLINVLKLKEKMVACEIAEKLPNVQVVGEVRTSLFCAGVDGGKGRVEFHRVRRSLGMARFTLW